MKKVMILFFVVLCSWAGQASASPSVRIGVVDLQKVVLQCREGVDDRARLLRRTDELNKELKGMLADLQKEKGNLEKDSSKLSVDARAESVEHLKKASRELQERRSDAQDELKRMESGYLKKLLGRLDVLITKIGEEGGYTAILDKKNGVFYASNNIDLTSLLIKRADAVYGK
jgi:outer membrane protein